MELDELFERKFNLDERIENFFGDDTNPHYGDRVYQDLLQEYGDVAEAIDKIVESIN